jgi:hypothetical protein
MRRARPLTAAEAGWLAAVPVGVLTALAVLLLGPPLGDVLLAGDPAPFFSWWIREMNPEPVEHARYLLALAAPPLLVAATFALVQRAPRLPALPRAWLVTGAQLVLLGFVVACLLAQWQIGFGRLDPPEVGERLHRDYFTAATLLAAALGTGAVVVAVTRAGVRTRFAAWTRDTRVRALLAGLVAVVAIVVWLLHAFNTEHTLAATYLEVDFHAMFTVDETFAVLDGRTPLVDFATQYAALWPYAFALAMSLLGDTIGIWIGFALTLTGLSMLAAYALLRRLARSALAGLLLFLPVLATSFFAITEPLADRYTFGNYYGAFPLRYAAPLVLAWLVVRHLDGARPRATWPLFLLCGLILLNSPDMGVPAIGATLAALLWAGGLPTRESLRGLALNALAGLTTALALVCALTLARAGELPDPGLLVRYARVFADAGFGMLPMPALGLHVVIYLTYVAAIGVATVRAIDVARDPDPARAASDRALVGALMWIGVFGLGAGAYYAGRSAPGFLTAMFSWWSLALALLVLVALPSLARWRRPGAALPIAQVACVFGFCVAACSLAQTPTPWGQIDRLRQHVRGYEAPVGQRFVVRHTRPGEATAILILLGHRIAYNLGLDDVAPYTGTLSMPLHEQLDETIARLRAAGGRKVFLTPEHTGPDFQLALGDAGFRLADEDADEAMELWVDEGAGSAGGGAR